MTVSLVLLVIWMPFVGQTDLYPLFRFGMFAEPIRQKIQTETFVLSVIETNGKQRWVDPAETGLGSLEYLMRNYYYRHETDTLLRRIHRIAPQPVAVRAWQLVRIVSEVSRYHPDTVVVSTYMVKHND